MQNSVLHETSYLSFLTALEKCRSFNIW